MLLIVDVSCAKVKAGIGFLFICGLNLTINSAAKCCASAAEPPFPQNNNFPPFLIFLNILITQICHLIFLIYSL